MIQESEIVRKILQTISKLSYLDRRKSIKFQDETLHPLEIHLLLHIYHVQNTNISKIAEELGPTKSAISQTIKRLRDDKKLIETITDPYKKNEMSINFTTKGEQIMVVLNKMIESIYQEFGSYIQKLSETEKITISEFLDHLVIVMEKQHNEH